MHAVLIDEYLAGTETLRRVVSDVTEGELDAHPIKNQWSIRQVICHIADFELIYADRMKRTLSEEHPTLAGGEPAIFASRLAYAHRSPSDELEVVHSIRRQMGVILRTLSAEDFQRHGLHPRNGPLTLATLLRRITDHLPHHLQFIEAKRQVLSRRRTS